MTLKLAKREIDKKAVAKGPKCSSFYTNNHLMSNECIMSILAIAAILRAKKRQEEESDGR